VLFDGHELAESMRRDGVTAEHAPVVPVREKRFIDAEESVTWLLEYKWRIDHSRGTPEVWIQRLRLNPIFLDQITTGWIAWVDPARYAALSSVLARRLYTIYAGEVALAEGETAFEHSIEALAARLGLPPGWPTFKTVQSIKLAARELVDAGILTEASIERRGRDAFLAAGAGPPMFFAGYLRGTSVLDDPGDRVLYVFLRFFGIPTPEARRLVYEHAYHTREALRWAAYIFDTAPATVTKNWAGFLRERITAGRTTEGDVGFARWYASRVATSERDDPSRRAVVTPAFESDASAPTRLQTPYVIVRTSEADDLLEAAKGLALGLDRIQLVYARALLAYAIEGDVLIAVTTMLIPDRNAQAISESMARALNTVSGGRVHVLRIDRYDPAIHAGSAPPVADGPALVSGEGTAS
jgi:hypothetical protein